MGTGGGGAGGRRGLSGGAEQAVERAHNANTASDDPNKPLSSDGSPLTTLPPRTTTPTDAPLPMGARISHLCPPPRQSADRPAGQAGRRDDLHAPIRLGKPARSGGARLLSMSGRTVACGHFAPLDACPGSTAAGVSCLHDLASPAHHRLHQLAVGGAGREPAAPLPGPRRPTATQGRRPVAPAVLEADAQGHDLRRAGPHPDAPKAREPGDPGRPPRRTWAAPAAAACASAPAAAPAAAPARPHGPAGPRRRRRRGGLLPGPRRLPPARRR